MSLFSRMGSLETKKCRYPPDNNLAEKNINLIVFRRRSWPVSEPSVRVEVSDLIHCPIETVTLNKLELCVCRRYIYDRLATASLLENNEGLLFQEIRLGRWKVSLLIEWHLTSELRICFSNTQKGVRCNRFGKEIVV